MCAAAVQPEGPDALTKLIPSLERVTVDYRRAATVVALLPGGRNHGP